MASRFVAACVIATLSFWAYTRTLVPGVDLGDTGGFQAAVLWPETSARQAYPLYYAVARPFVSAVSATNPARGLNLFSALWGGVAVGLLTYICAEVMGSTASGMVAGLLFAFSYTFWTQAIIAEVYTLHLTLVGLCLLALKAYARRPDVLRLAMFFAVYALGFGNHLSMILLLVPFALFLVQTTPEPRALFRPRIVALAIVIASAGALQYLPNLMAVWNAVDAPARWADRFAAFWFDVTKADWRESMVLGVGQSQIADRAGMWWFDARQQFGVLGLVLAAAGSVRLWQVSRPWSVLLLSGWAFCTTFALSYNVGDAHVFFLPSHLLTAFLAGAAVALPGASGLRTVWTLRVITCAVLAYAGWRGWDTWPAVDRHDDRRGEQLMTRLTLGLDERSVLLVTDLNWQLENVLLYQSRYEHRNVAWTRLPDVLPHFPFLVRDNEQISRDIVLTAGAAGSVVSAYGPLFPLIEDSVVPVDSLAAIVERVPPGAPYVLSVLTPPREERLDQDALATAVGILTRGHPPPLATTGYEVIAGLAGEPAVLSRSSARPFRQTFQILDEPFTVRMESWLPTDTFRRAGFGQLLRGREQVLILERGVSLVWFRGDGSPSPPIYAASLLAEKPRFRIAPPPARLALGTGP